MDSVMGKFRVLSMMYDAWVLKSARTPPRAYMDFVGGGIRNKRNAIGITDAIVAFTLNKNNIIPKPLVCFGGFTYGAVNNINTTGEF